MKACDKKLNRKRSVADAETPQITKFFTVKKVCDLYTHIAKFSFKVKDMRMHVGRHILRKTLASPHSVSTCGYCGQGTCISTLVVSSQRGQKKYYKVETDCCYKFQTSKSKAAFTARNKCTNVVLECYICHKSIWKYNLPLHMAEQHVGVDVLDADIVSEEEKSFFSKK